MTKDMLRKIYPNLSDEELERAEVNLVRYVELAWEIYEDLNRDRFDSRTPHS